MMKKLVILAAFCLILVLANTSLAAWGDYDTNSYTAYWDAEKGVWTTDKTDIVPYGKCSTCDGHILIYEVSDNAATMSWENAKGDIIPLHGIEAADTIDNTPYVPEDNSETGTTIGKLKAVQTNPDSAALTLSWESTTADGYVVERKDSANNWKRIAVISDPSYIDDSVSVNTPYEYRVKPYKSSSKGRTYGSYSGVLKVTPIVFTEIVPSNFKAVPIEEGSTPGFSLSWGAVGGADGYIIERSGPGDPASKTVSAASYQDTDAVTPGAQYTYKVYAYAGSGADRKVTKDATATVTAVMPKPKAPGNFNAVAGDSLEVTLTWGKVDGVSYSIERSADGSNWDFTKDGVTSPYKDKVSAVGMYYYRIRAYYASTPDNVYSGYTEFDSGIKVDDVLRVSDAEARVNGVYYDLDYDGVKSPRTARVGDNTGSRCTLTTLDIPGEITVGGVTYVVDAYRDNTNGFSFNNNESITTIKYTGVNVKNLRYTFYRMKALKTVNSDALNGPVDSLYYTFDYCASLTDAPTIPNGVTDMLGTFFGCTSLSNAPIIPNSVTNMNSTFSGCTSLSNAPIIPNSVTNMGRTFFECTSLTSAPEIPSSVADMQYAFYGCASLIAVPEIPNGVTNMLYTFCGCTRVTAAPEIPNSVTNMGLTFYKCESLTSAPEIPDSVISMSYAFGDCTSLTSAGAVRAPKTTDVFYAYSNTKLVPSARPDLTGYLNAASAFRGCPSA